MMERDMLRELTIHEMSFVSGAEGTELCSDSHDGGGSYSSYDGGSKIDVGLVGWLTKFALDGLRAIAYSYAYDELKEKEMPSGGYPGTAQNGYGSYQKNDDYNGYFGGDIYNRSEPFSDPAS